MSASIRDYDFGTFLHESRKEINISQSKLASLLGVSNKAVSKWETGVAKPSVEKLVQLSKILSVSLEDLINIHMGKRKKQVTKIVITGGPCAGKSTAIDLVQETFSKMGYSVLYIREVATELILSGLSRNTCESWYDFQLAILKLQLYKEKLYEENAQKLMKDNKVLIICDRGVMDGKAYIEDYQFARILKSLGLKEIDLRDSYDAVFHLVTAAKGAEEFYSNINNKARFESVEEARVADDKTISAWSGHSHLRIIDNSTDFEGKLNRLINEIMAFVGEEKPEEIERKYLIEYPDINFLKNFKTCKRAEIVQTYLKSKNPNESVRIRQRGYKGVYSYTKTIKKDISSTTREEYETKISQAEYINLLTQADSNHRQIIKTRYSLVYKNQYFEIDIYPEWHDRAIMEIELREENQEVIIPPFIKVIKEVTDDMSYRNENLSAGPKKKKK